MPTKSPVPLFIISFLIFVLLWTWKENEHPFSETGPLFAPKVQRMMKPTQKTARPVTAEPMYAEENAVFTVPQKPGESVVINNVLLSVEGYVVIHEDDNGKPGDILGSSELLTKGEHTNVEVNLERTTEDGEKLYAMLHAEQNDPTSFELASDKPLMSKFKRAPVMMMFEVANEATQAGPEVTP